MAEATAFENFGKEFKRGGNISITDDGISLNFNITIPRASILKSILKRRAKRWLNFWTNAIYPWGALTFGACGILGVATVVNVEETHWLRDGKIANFMWDLCMRFPWVPNLNRYVKIGIVAFWAYFGVFLGVVSIHRLTLRALLAWRGWLYAERGKTPLSLKLWAVGLKMLLGRKPLTYGYQSSLPFLPLPSLKETCNRYLESMSSLLPKEEFIELQESCQDFLKKEGNTLQRYLSLKHFFTSNYVSQWWLDFCYLRGRGSIAVNSNYYGLDSSHHYPKALQTSRAANIVSSFLTYKKLLEEEKIRPYMVNNLVPLCMDQYKKTFSTTRLPGMEQDVLKHYEPEDSLHIAVLVAPGHWYAVEFQKPSGAYLDVLELEEQFEWIINDAKTRGKVSDGTERIPSLTGGDRVNWAKARDSYFASGKNRLALDIVERACFVLVFDPQSPKDWSEQARMLIHGDGTNLWFDKSFCLVAFANGKFGFNGEHSWADAPVLGHAWEYSMLTGEHLGPGYNEEGRNVVPQGYKKNLKLSRPKHLEWEIVEGLAASIDTASDTLKGIADELNLTVIQSDYGSGLIKKFKCSPDSYAQCALQLAYFLTHGTFVQTYESAMTRFYRLGRTETIRSACNETAAFVRSMVDPSSTSSQQMKLLNLAVDKHSLIAKDAMSGKGVDRHLFCLYVTAMGTNTDSKFLKAAMGNPWMLSTSQQNQQQTDRWDLKKPEDAVYVSAGGGFGPVCKDGYGVSYMMFPEDRIYFHVSSLKNKKSNHQEFLKNITKALSMMKEMCEKEVKEVKKEKKE